MDCCVWYYESKIIISRPFTLCVFYICSKTYRFAEGRCFRKKTKHRRYVKCIRRRGIYGQKDTD